MIPLPICRWRDYPEGRDGDTCSCTSTKLMGDKSRLPLSFCAEQCPKHYIDHEPEPPASPPQEPGLLTKAINAIAATSRVAAAVATRASVLVSDAQHAARIAICRACDQYNAVRNTCAKCGCFIVKHKAKLATEDCPLKKWPRTGQSTPPP